MSSVENIEKLLTGLIKIILIKFLLKMLKFCGIGPDFNLS